MFQMTKLSEEERKHFTSDFGLLAEYIALQSEPEKLEEFIRKNKQAIRHPEEFLDVLSAISGGGIYKSVEKQFLETAEKGEVTMDSIWEKCVQEGRQEGKQEGSDMKAKTVARNMFLRGMSLEDTAALCGENPDKIRNWFAEWNK